MASEGKIAVRCVGCGTSILATPTPLADYVCTECDVRLREYWAAYDRRQASCPHGVEGPCNACDQASDFAYDANREGRR